LKKVTVVKQGDRPRVGLVGFLHETNTFAQTRATYDSFVMADAWPGLLVGAEIMSQTKGKNLPIAGFVKASLSSWELVPLLWCSCAPCGPVTTKAYEKIVHDILLLIEQQGPFDALYLDLHGAMVAEHVDDGEGELLSRIRQHVGMAMPIVCNLDFHANISDQMTELSSAITIYRTYPHVDMAETGARTATILASLLEGQMSASVMAKHDMPIAMTDQYTEEGLLSGIMDWIKQQDTAAAHVEFAPGFPLADVSFCGPTIVAYAESEQKAQGLLEAALDHIRPYYAQPTQKLYCVEEAYNEYMRLNVSKPVIWADVQDNPGCGGEGNTIGILQFLHSNEAKDVLLGIMCVPETAVQAHAAGVGAELYADLGDEGGLYGPALHVRVVVEALSNGRFVGSGAFYKGCAFELGPMACLRLGDIRVLVSSRPQQAADKAMFNHMGIEPEQVKLLVLKSAVHFRAAFSEMADSMWLIKSPGVAPSDPADLKYSRAFQ